MFLMVEFPRIHQNGVNFSVVYYEKVRGSSITCRKKEKKGKVCIRFYYAQAFKIPVLY